MLYLPKNVPTLQELVNMLGEKLGCDDVEAHYGTYNSGISDLVLHYKMGEEISTCPPALNGMSQKSAIITMQQYSCTINIDFFNKTFWIPGKPLTEVPNDVIEAMGSSGFDFLDFKYA